MKNPIQFFARRFKGYCLGLLVLVMALPCAHAGLTFTLDFYRSDQAQHFIFYTPLATNNLLPAAPLGTYIISSPSWPTNGSQRAFDLTASGLSDHADLDVENSYSDFYSAVHDITNGFWKIVFTNNTTTNHYTFTIHSPNINSNVLPAMVHLNPNDGTYVPTNIVTLTWLGPTNWGVFGSAEVYKDSLFIPTNLPASQTQWTLPLDPGLNYTFYLNYVTNCATPLFTVSTPLNTNNSQPISGWSYTNILETGNTTVFSVSIPTGTPTHGHTNEAFWAFDDNTLFTADLSGNGNSVNGYAWFNVPPSIVTNDAAYGLYAAGFYGGDWLTPPTNLVTTLQGSFSVSLWVKTTNSPSGDYAEGTSGGGLVTANSDASEPMVLTGHQLAFETGGNPPNTLHSATRINNGVYTHIVVTRDVFTGQKIIYINGVQDVSDYAAPGPLVSSQNPVLLVGENSAFQNDFVGNLDQIQIYSGVLSSNDVTFLFHNPGTNVANTSSADVSLPPVAVYDFASTNDNPGTDDSGHGNNANCGSGDGDENPADQDIYVTNAASGMFAREYFGHNAFCFDPVGGAFTNLANALDGSFTVTAWVLTTASDGNDDDEALFGNPVMFVDTSNTNLLVPLAITGSKLAFTISGPDGNDTQLHSTATINDGTYHFIGVTRNQTNGIIKLFVDGNLEAITTGPTNRLTLHSDIFVAGGYYGFYQGILDDVRIYGGELPPADMAQLAGNSIITLGEAVNAPMLPWTTSGDTLWFVETTNTFDNIAAAQSGPVTNDQISVISTTVTGPGTVTFAWSSQASSDGDFEYQFNIDDNNYDSLTGDSDWQQDGPFDVPSGTHTLTWTALANGDMDPTEVGFLDEVVFTLNNPVVLVSPQMNGAFFEFQFQTKSGFTYEVQYCTNLAVGAWQTYTFVAGDDTSHTTDVPLFLFAPAKQGFVRVVPQ